MTRCPDCGCANLPGADHCEQCGQSLVVAGKTPSQSALARDISKDRVERLSPRRPLCVAPDLPVGIVLQVLDDHRIGCAIVEDEGKVVGIFTERDALHKLNVNAAALADRPVREFMTPDPEVLHSGDRIAFALHRMDLGGYRHLPIVDGDRAVGVISIRDILRYMAERLVSA